MRHQRTRYSAGRDNRPAALALFVVPVLAGLAWWTWQHTERVEVSGLSMAPGLQPGDRLLIWKTTAVRTGDIVDAPDPRQPDRAVLKRAGAVGPDGVLLLGDNPDQSTDGRHFGRIPATSVRGKVVYRYAPPSRSGRLRRT